jgi:hypothetical protein
MEPFNYTVVQRRKREYLTKFEQIASEVPNIEELYKILSMSHKLFMDLLVVILVIIV